jgi:hypothetical protein
MVASTALALGMLLLGDGGGSPEQPAKPVAGVEAADVLWSYDTGG